jgi:hypothetical protein
MIALSLGRRKPLLTLPCAIGDRAGQAAGSAVRNALKAKAGRQNLARRDVPKADASKFSLKIPKADGRLAPRTSTIGTGAVVRSRF